jgi:ribosomal protein L25 (general stress protein Ctc)
MKETLSLAVKTRAGRGKGANRKLRATDMVPGVYYDDKGVNIPVMVEHMPLQKLYSKTASSHVFELKIDSEAGQETKPSLIWQLQFHPTKKDHPRGLLRRGPDQGIPRPHHRGSGGKASAWSRAALWKSTARHGSQLSAWPSRTRCRGHTRAGPNLHIKVADITLPEGARRLQDNSPSWACCCPG